MWLRRSDGSYMLLLDEEKLAALFLFGTWLLLEIVREIRRADNA